MTKLIVYSWTLAAVMATLYLMFPERVEGGIMKKGMGMMGGGGGGGVMELLAAGIVAKILGELKMNMGGDMQMKPMTKYVPVPIFVSTGGSMMGWKGGMMMDSGWMGGMMNSGWKGGMMGGD